MIQMSPYFVAKELKPDIQAIADFAGDSIFLTTVDGRMEWCNQSFSLLFGYTFEEAAGRRPLNFLSGPETDLQLLESLGEKLDTEKDLCTDLAFYAKSGCLRWVSVRINPFFNEHQQLTHYLWIARDISELHDLLVQKTELEETIKKLSKVATSGNHS